MRGKTAIPAFAISVIGGIQPGPLERYVRGAFSGERADGLLQRFQLAVWPDAPAFEYVDRWPSKESKDVAAMPVPNAQPGESPAPGVTVESVEIREVIGQI